MTALIDALAVVPVIGIARRCPARHAAIVAGAAAQAGLRVLEITMDADDACDAIVAARDGRLIVGAGTVRSIADAAAAIEAGAQFLIAPGLDPAVIAYAREQRIEMIPGVLTPTEIDAASRTLSSRSAVVKLFPAGPAGSDYFAAVRQPFPDVSFVCTGGINSANARAFLDRGALAVGIGESAFPSAALHRGDGRVIERATREVVDAITR